MSDVLVPLAAVTALGLALRLLHIAFTAKRLVADDAVFFQTHAERFLAAWHSLGEPIFWPALREAIDHASLQGIVYPLFQSLVYLAAGSVDHTWLVVAQAILSAATVTLTFLTARRAFGPPAGLAAGVLAAIYPPFVISAGLLLAETLLVFLQAVAIYLLVAGLAGTGRRAAVTRLGGGLCVGLLMLRPAFQYAGPVLFLALAAIAWQRHRARPEPVAASVKWLAPYVAGVLLIALPWIATNGIVFGSVAWSRTGDAWQQVYWGIFPPNHGWWPPDSPVPPKYGVESLPGAWAMGVQIEPRDLDYLEAAIQQVLSTPLKALATEVNKLYRAYLHPFNTYAESPPLIGALIVPAHRLVVLLAAAGLAMAWRRPAASALLVAALAASALPFLVSHIDVRYTVPPVQIGMVFAGLAGARFAMALQAVWRLPVRRVLLPFLAIGLPGAAGVLAPRWVLGALPDLAPWYVHLFQTAVTAAALVVAGASAGWLAACGDRHGAPFQRGTLAGRLEHRSSIRPVGGSDEGRTTKDECRFVLRRSSSVWWRHYLTGALVGAVLAAVFVTHALYEGDWHEWTAVVPPGGTVRQTFELPPGWQPPPGSRGEVRLYLAGTPTTSYVPVVRVNGHEAGRLGPGFTWVGPLRGVERFLMTAAQQGKQPAEVPRWYAAGFDVELIAGNRVEVELHVEPARGAGDKGGAGAGHVRVWGDHEPRPGIRLFEGPAVYSRFPGADVAFHKFVATGEYGIWRWASLESVRVSSAWRASADGPWHSSDLSAAAGRQTGEYRIRLLILGPSGELLHLF